MNTVRIIKEFTFETAHALEGYDGKCKDIHGHSYQLDVCLIGTPILDVNHVKNGMLIDFGDLKAIVKKNIVTPWDHALVLRKDSRFAHLINQGSKIIFTDYQPTCENMIVDFAAILREVLPENLTLHSLRLRETGTAYAEWHASDQ